MNKPQYTAQIFQHYRLLLFSIAYRMLGSATDAEDIVQDAFLRWLQASDKDVQSPKAYLSTIVVRLCLNQLNSAREQREVYVGPWLPEPIATGQMPELAETVAQAESLSLAFLLMLEKLNPLERAVFLLHEVFEYEYSEIAAIVEKSTVNCRQIFHRAQQHLDKHPARFSASREQQEHITNSFLQASLNGDMQELLSLLSNDIVSMGDSGGKAALKAGLLPIYGSQKVSRGYLGALRSLPPGVVTRITEVNGQPAIVAYLNEKPVGAILFQIKNGQISQLYYIVNPDKLNWL
ncbi:RNA polymerase sigma-70 factor [Dictyobacter arantiisoli]|uniref:DNA-directed RNA polymerase sigma-70 factor n=1 Tax=Dictyobacter arantiisoli TaxID=2014874 RepID=A0A5A5TB78_9CHLR|nr:RNA polymerase sigma-70 factor [Dictyobacter arantiisoli]GCF08495.1 DNA-directed RNA polymerase sigma-70 factor [Dictyobacter arantiisoli]